MYLTTRKNKYAYKENISVKVPTDVTKVRNKNFSPKKGNPYYGDVI